MSACGGCRPVRCAIHVHSAYHDGDVSLDRIARDAREAEVDALLLTDHHAAHAAEDGWAGWHDGLLVVVGAEYSTRRHHLLAFGLHDKVRTRCLETADALRLFERLGATVFLPHPQGHRRHGFLPRIRRWTDWDAAGYHGLEVWGYMHDWADRVSPRALPAMCRGPDAHITGPEEAILRRWDEAARTRIVAGIGGIDNHARMLPLGIGRLFPWAREGILPHAHCFRAFSTYAFCPPLEGSDAHDTHRVLTALREGCAWVCRDALASGRDFRFRAETPAGLLLPGEARPYARGIVLEAVAPRPAAMRLLCRGAVVAENEGTTLRHIPDAPGEYRVEVRLDGRIWILSNHMYLRG